MESNQNNETNQQGKDEIKLIDVTDMVPVNKDELNELIAQNLQQKQELGALVGLFRNFEVLFTGKSNLGSLMTLIPKLMNDPKMKSDIEEILPIIQKYNQC